MPVPTISEIGTALRTKLANVVGSDAVILAESEDATPDLKGPLIIQSVNPGIVMPGELGGRAGVSRQTGVFSVTISYGRSTANGKATTWDLAQNITDAFRREVLPAGKDCHVNIEEPWITNIGSGSAMYGHSLSSSTGRMSLLVTIPWWTWTGGEL